MKPSSPKLTDTHIAGLMAQTDRAYHVALRATGVPALAEEAVQEAYAAMIQKPPQDLGPDERVGYFFRTVRGIALNMQRSSRRQKVREEIHAMSNRPQAGGADEAAARNELASAARHAMTDLPQDEREAIGLCCEMDLTHREAAEILGVPESTLGARLNRGLEKLRLRLSAQGFASLAPLGIAGALGELGVVKAPAGLSASLQALSANVAKAGAAASAKIAAKSVAAKHAAAGAGIGTKVAIAAVLVVSASGAYVAMQRDAPKAKAPEKEEAPAIEAAAPAAGVPAAAKAKPPATPRMVWQDSFETLDPWSVTEWRAKGNILFEQVAEDAHSPPSALRFKYTFPNLKPKNRQMDDWLVNHRTFERQLQVAEGARRLRLWLKVVSNKPGAEFNLALYPADRKSAWSFSLKLDEMGDGWTELEFDLNAMPGYWRENVLSRYGKEVPPLEPKQIAFMEIGMNWADAEVLLDDLEFVTEPEPDAEF